MEKTQRRACDHNGEVGVDGNGIAHHACYWALPGYFYFRCGNLGLHPAPMHDPPLGSGNTRGWGRPPPPRTRLFCDWRPAVRHAMARSSCLPWKSVTAVTHMCILRPFSHDVAPLPLSSRALCPRQDASPAHLPIAWFAVAQQRSPCHPYARPRLRSLPQMWTSQAYPHVDLGKFCDFRRFTC
jgi:hypothetical protein